MKKNFWIWAVAMSIFLIAAAPKNVINVRKGAHFPIILESNRTTGYEWQVDGQLDGKIVKFVDSRYLAPGGKTVLRVGQGGKERWTFKAVGKGKTTISFKYVRPWEEGTPPVQTAVYTIVVK